MTLLTIGVVGSSLKENEYRVPIHPHHIDWMSDKVRAQLFFERGYGEPFGIDDAAILAQGVGGVTDRNALFTDLDVILLPKPTQQDFDMLREGSILWGWPHCVQQREFTQTAIDQHLTLIAWEAMYKWSQRGTRQLHIFYRNNEMAGYAGVLDALRLVGRDGKYGPSQKAAVISFGSVSRGALFALKGRGFTDITVYTQRPTHLVSHKIMGVTYHQIQRNGPEGLLCLHPDGTEHPFVEELGEADVIVNGILQDTDNPLMYFKKGESDQLKPQSLIVDVSCDKGMGFPFARPTTFEEPVFQVGPEVDYYAVDHTPSYLWKSASWEISESLLPFLPIVAGGPERWAENETIRRAIEIRDGVIQNPKILSFQQRTAEYPHRALAVSG